jgi:hypothetical protein
MALASHRTDSCASSLGASHRADSRASSLGPSDSASQQKLDFAIDEAIENLLQSVEAPSMRPQFLPVSVLWHYEDCENDSEGVIIMEHNKRRPSMTLALRCPDGTKLSHQELTNMRHSTDIVVQKLVTTVKSSPLFDADTSKPTKLFIRTVFLTEYHQAILELEAEQKLLCLCSGHWKADTMIGQALSRRNDAQSKSQRERDRSSNPSNPNDSWPPEPSHSIPCISDRAPANAAKHALDLSPGPKSPSMSRTQKRSKDDIMHPQQQTTNPVPSNNSECMIR